MAAIDGIEGVEGTAPITVEPVELVFNTDEVVLHGIPIQTRKVAFSLKCLQVK